MLSGTIWLWIGFNVFVLAMLALDLGVFHRKAHAVSIKEASIWSVVWIILAMAFNAGVYFFSGPEPALQFFTGYLIEKSLSVDNIFVFGLLFTYFKVPAASQHRVLFWGVLGALVLRGMLIVLGTSLLATFQWIIYLFGAFLIFTGVRMIFHKEEEVHPERNPLLILTTVYNCAQIKLTAPRDGCSLWEMPFNISAGDSHDQEQDSEQDTRLSRA